MFRNTADTATITSASIVGGASDATFKYKDTLAGTPTISAADHASVLTSGLLEQEAVNAGNGSKLVFLTGRRR